MSVVSTITRSVAVHCEALANTVECYIVASNTENKRETLLCNTVVSTRDELLCNKNGRYYHDVAAAFVTVYLHMYTYIHRFYFRQHGPQ